MTLENGYEMTTTFIEDFQLANYFGAWAVRETFEIAFDEWKDNYIYLTELVISLNLHLWSEYGKGNEPLARVYDELWRQADEYACDNLKGEELSFFYNTTD